ncbi:MAG TPA: pentapeptide repeat-containing protein [Iamia sp.]
MSASAPIDGPPSAVTRIRALVFIDGPTDEPRSLAAVLDALTAQPATTPTHGSYNDGMRTPFAADALAADAGGLSTTVWLWRRARPRLFGSVDAFSQAIARISLEYEGIAADDVEPVYLAVEQLVDRLAPVYAGVHVAEAEMDDERAASLRGMSTKALEYRKTGPPGVFASTWFGSDLVARFPPGTIEEAGGRPTAWGGMSVRLDDRPWALPFAELRARQVAVDAALRPHGVLADRSTVPQAGPAWTPIPNVVAPPAPAPPPPRRPPLPADWEALRGTGRPVIGADLRGEDLRDADLTGLRFEEATADRVDLRGALMDGVTVVGGSFVEARFDGASLGGAIFFDAVLARARFDGATLDDGSVATCSASGATFVGARLCRTDLLGAFLDGADLSGAVLTNANLRHADLRGAVLRGADLSEADLTGAAIEGADLTDVVLDDTTLPR